MKVTNFSPVVKNFARCAVVLSFVSTIFGCGDLITVEDSVGDSSSGSVYVECEVTDPAGEVALSFGDTGFGSINSVNIDVETPATKFFRSYPGEGKPNWFGYEDIRGREGHKVSADFVVRDNNMTKPFERTVTAICR